MRYRGMATPSHVTEINCDALLAEACELPVKATYLGYWHVVSVSDVSAVSWRSLAQSADAPGSCQPLTSKHSSIVSSAMCTKAAALAAALCSAHPSTLKAGVS